jgi:hypothetical protein
MVLRFTMAEFRKIQSNDKILFGVLIAIIIFNSMIPRVIEGLSPGSIYNVITPKIVTSTSGNAPTAGDGVLSISGSFRTSVAIANGHVLIFEFPRGYFAKPTAATTDATVVPVKINITQTTGTTSTPIITDLIAATTSTFGVLAGSTPKLMFTIGTAAIPANTSDATSRDYQFTISSSSTTAGSEMFKFGPDQIEQTQNGFKIGAASTATATTSDIATSGSAGMPILYKPNAASSASTSMNARQQGIINNIARIQMIEKQLLGKLNTDISATDRSEIVAQINDLAKARGDLYNNMNDFSSQIEMVASERRNALVQNSVAVNVIRDQIANSSNTLDGLQQDKSNKMRLVEINNYYGKKYEFQTDIMKIIILTCVPVLVVSILLKKGFIPNLIATGLIILIIAAGVIAVARKVMDLNRRNRFNFDQYDHPFNPYAVSVTTTNKETTNLADLNEISMDYSCIGSNCCTETTTVWNPSEGKCFPRSATDKPVTDKPTPPPVLNTNGIPS